MSEAILKIREKRKNKDGECLIYIQYCYRQKPTLISTGEKIDAKHWDAENGKIKSSLKGYAGKNDLLGHKRDSVNDIVRRLKIADKEPIGELVKEEFEKRQNKGDEPKDLLQYYQVYLDEVAKKFGTGTMAGKKTNLEHLKKFAAAKKLKLTFDSINKDFYDKFTLYLIELRLANNTIGKQIKNLKAVLNYFSEKGLNSNLAYKKFTKPTNDTTIITFEEKELKAIHKLKSLTPSLQRAKDLLLLECYTGLRYSDIQNLKPENIDFENAE
jgi:integrase